MTRAFFRGGPLDGQFKILPNPMATFEVMRPEPLNWSHWIDTDVSVPSKPVKGRYTLVPLEKDVPRRYSRLYDWAGWDDKKP